MENRPTILVTGANGQLGNEIQQLSASFPEYAFTFLTKEDLAIDHTKEVEFFFAENKVDYLINCAAYTAVDKAEAETVHAFKINGEAAGVLAAVCKKYNSRFIHISTDYVFDGTATVPYTEDAPTNPQGVYGASKLKGEKTAFENNANSVVIRTSWVYSSFGKNFVKTMIKLMSEKDEINVVNDQVGSPTYAANLAEVILQVISSGKWDAGIYHYANKGITNWYKFALAIKKITGSKCKVNPISTSQYPTPAKRPAYSVLDTSRIHNTYAIQLKNWEDSLRICMEKIANA